MRSDALEHVVARPHTIAEVEAGIIALPNAPISPSQRGGDTPIVGKIGHGDATVQTGIHVLYRFHRDWILGAGAIFAPSRHRRQTVRRSLVALTWRMRGRTSSSESRDATFRSVTSRSRVGVGLSPRRRDHRRGLRFHTDAPAVPPILGVPDVTLRTEGFAVGVQAGVTYYLTDNLLAGANLRGYQWILPESRECSPLGDCATLSGAIEVFELGLTIGYRLPL